MGCGTSRVDSVVIPPPNGDVPMNKLDVIHSEDRFKSTSNGGTHKEQANGINGVENKLFTIDSRITESSEDKNKDIPSQNTVGIVNKNFVSDGTVIVEEFDNCEGQKEENIERLEDESYLPTLSSLGKHDTRRNELYSSLTVFADADDRALTAPDSLKSSEDKLVAYLTEQFQHSDLLKLRVIWRWVTHNILYDVESYFNPDQSNEEEMENILLSGKSVCSGYSNLFKTMCTLAGLPVVCIPGWSKGYEFEVGATFTGSNTNHLWNAVLVNESWWLFDCTWGAGYIDENKNFVQQYEEHFFMTDPDQFVYDHFPSNPKWQLLETPIAMSEYEEMPLLTRHFFKAQLKAVSHEKVRVPCSDGKVHMKFKMRKENPVKCVGSLISSDGVQVNEEFLHIYTTDKILHAHVLVPDVGVFTLKLFGGCAESALTDDTGLPLICTYLIYCTVKTEPVQTYPKQFKKWCHGFKLHSPMEGRLTIDETYKFKVSVTNMAKMAVCLGGNDVSTVTYLKNTSSAIWESDVRILPGVERITVVGKFMGNSNTQSFSSLLEYAVNTNVRGTSRDL